MSWLGARWAWVAVLCAAAAALGGPSALAQADSTDPLFVFSPSQLKPPPPVADFEGPCGLAVDSAGDFYVSDYYHHAVDVFTSGPGYVTQLPGVDPIDGPCGLAVGPTGELYVNDFHRDVASFSPSAFPPVKGTTFPFTPPTTYAPAAIVDSSHPTGVAVDPVTAAVYVDDRTHVAVYDSSGAPILQVGAGSLEDGYGIAVSAFPATAGRLYVPDAATDTVKVYDPALDTADPVATIDGHAIPGGGFVSLRDSAVAVDRVSGEVYVVDDLQPEYAERPEAAIYAFDSTGAYEGRLKYNVVDAAPPGLAVDNSATATQGRVYVTSGNTEKAVVYAYPPGVASAASFPFAPSGVKIQGEAAGSSPAGKVTSAGAGASSSSGGPEAQASAIAQKGALRVTVAGKLSPRSLPRGGAAPIAVTVSGQIATTDASPPPQLKTLRVELNRHGHLDYAGLSTCPYDSIQPASTSHALSACRSALVGQGSFNADITLAGQEPYPTKGRLLVFNGRRGGKRVLFGHIYSPHPFATSFVIVFAVQKLSGGTFGTALSASLPEALGSWGNLTGIEMTLGRRYSYWGRPHSYLSSGCPAPKGFPGAVFSLARTSFGFAGGAQLTSVLRGACRVRGG